MTEKQAARRRLRARLLDLPMPSGAIRERLLPLIAPEGSLFCFVGAPGEVDTLPLLARWLSEGREVSVPLWFAGGVMQPRRIFSLSELRQDARGFYRPPEDAPVMLRPDIAIVPGLSFDRRGYRLGRGGGYYDRFLADFSGTSLGVCPDALLSDCLPVEPHDRPVNFLITESLSLSLPNL